MISHGQYKGKAIAASVQLGETESGNLQIAVDLNLHTAEDQPLLGSMTTFLYFSQQAAPYSYERLRALGWKGNGPDDIDDKMLGIDANWVDARVTQAESYKATDGSMKMGTSKLEILTGGGKVTLAKKLDVATFKARLRALGGSSGGPAAPQAGGGTAPPF